MSVQRLPKISKLLAIPVLLVSLLVAGLRAPHVYAASSLYFSPTSGSVQNGNTINAVVRVNAASGADTITTVLNYPASQLDYVSFSAGSSAPNSFGQSAGGGTFTVTTYVNPGSPAFTGDQLVLTVTFRAKVSSGSGAITFGGGTEVFAGGDVQGGGSGSFTANFTAPPTPPPAPGPSPSPSPGPSPSPSPSPTTPGTKPSPSPTPPKTPGTPPAATPPASTPPTQADPAVDTQAPVISDISVNASNRAVGAVITWKSNEAGTSTVEYGQDNVMGQIVEGAGNVLEHTATITPAFLKAGQIVYYRVSTQDGNGNKATSEVQRFVAPGITVTIEVTDKGGKPVKDAKVSIPATSQIATTNDSGQAVFDNAPAGPFEFVIEKGKEKKSTNFTVSENEEKQFFEVKLAASKDNKTGVIITGVAIVGIGALILFMISRFRNRHGGFGGAVFKNETSSWNPLKGRGRGADPSGAITGPNKPAPNVRAPAPTVIQADLAMPPEGPLELPKPPVKPAEGGAISPTEIKK